MLDWAWFEVYTVCFVSIFAGNDRICFMEEKLGVCYQKEQF